MISLIKVKKIYQSKMMMIIKNLIKKMTKHHLNFLKDVSYVVVSS